MKDIDGELADAKARVALLEKEAAHHAKEIALRDKNIAEVESDLEQKQEKIVELTQKQFERIELLQKNH